MSLKCVEKERRCGCHWRGSTAALARLDACFDGNSRAGIDANLCVAYKSPKARHATRARSALVDGYIFSDETGTRVPCARRRLARD